MKKIYAILALLIVLGGGASAYEIRHTSQDVRVTVAATATPTPSQDIILTGKEGKSALAVLKEGHTVKEKNSSYGIFIDGIDGLNGDATHYWAFYVNGNYASVGADAYQSKASDKVEFRYEAIK